MESQHESEHETCRVIVLGGDRSEVLLGDTDAGFVLPSIAIPRSERVAENLTAALKQNWGCEAVCLFTPTQFSRDDHFENKHHEVLECWNCAGSHSRGVWRSIGSLTTDCFQNTKEFRVIEQCLHELDSHECSSSSPFARRGWFWELREWVADAIRAIGLELTGPFRQFNASPTFSLIRFETTGRPVWFKAIGEPNLREFRITLELAKRFPEFTPQTLASKPEWNGWLSLEAMGKNLGDTKDIACWEQAAAALAKLQIESILHCESLLALAAHDLRFDRLFSGIDPFFDLVARLMGEQTKVPPAILSREDLGLTRMLVDDALTMLADLEIPSTLGHLDLNPWNIIVSADGSIFLDWAEAYIGHPFFSLQYLLEHFRRDAATAAAHRSQIVDAYKTPWRHLISSDRIDEALALTPLAAVFVYAGTGTWKDEEKLRDPKLAGYFRALARRMHREAIQSMERRSSCLG